MIVNLRHLFILCALVIACKGAGPDDSQEEATNRYARVSPSTMLREGPGLEHEVLEVLREKAPLEFIQESESPPQTILGLTGRWCKVKSKQHTGWVFCPLLAENSWNETLVVIKGRAVSKSSDEFHKLAGFEECQPLTPEKIAGFKGGCLRAPCYECYGEHLKPDGSLVFLDQTVSGCSTLGKGRWQAHDNFIKTDYKIGEGVFPHDACVTNDEARMQIQEHGEKVYGKVSAEISVEQFISVDAEGKIYVEHKAIDPAPVPGKKSLAEYLLSKPPRESVCFFPYSEPEQH